MKLREKVVSTLKELKLNGMVEALEQQFASPDYESQSFLERLDNLVTNESLSFRNRRIQYLQKQSKLRWPQANIAGINYSLHPSLKPAVIKELSELEWIAKKHHIIVTGATGTGKTYIACALAQHAIMEAIPVLSFRFNELILNLLAAEKTDKLLAFKRRLNKAPVLLIDDWGISPMSAAERHLLFELIENRDRNGSVIITSQYPVKAWYDAFQDPTIADATLDRIVHQAHQITLKGESIRKAIGMKGDAS